MQCTYLVRGGVIRLAVGVLVEKPLSHCFRGGYLMVFPKFPLQYFIAAIPWFYETVLALESHSPAQNLPLYRVVA
jgi:hypothetical protein